MRLSTGAVVDVYRVSDTADHLTGLVHLIHSSAAAGAMSPVSQLKKQRLGEACLTRLGWKSENLGHVKSGSDG